MFVAVKLQFYHCLCYVNHFHWRTSCNNSSFSSVWQISAILSLSYRMGKSTVSYIIRETCDAIYSVLSPKHLQPPTSQEHWLTLSKQFEEQWNLPHVIGARDEKHIRIQCPVANNFLKTTITTSISCTSCLCDSENEESVSIL